MKSILSVWPPCEPLRKGLTLAPYNWMRWNVFAIFVKQMFIEYKRTWRSSEIWIWLLVVLVVVNVLKEIVIRALVTVHSEIFLDIKIACAHHYICYVIKIETRQGELIEQKLVEWLNIRNAVVCGGNRPGLLGPMIHMQNNSRIEHALEFIYECHTKTLAHKIVRKSANFTTAVRSVC